MEKSILQRHAELSKFDDGAVRSRREASCAAADLAQASKLPVVPARCDYVYAPSAPTADWAGLVVTQKRRAQVRGRASQASLTQSEAGIVGSDADRQLCGRRRFETTTPALWAAASTPRTTAAHDAMQGQRGGLDSHKRRGKKLVRPAHAGQQQYAPASCQQDLETSADHRLVGYRAKELSVAGPTMLSRVAHSIMSGFEPPPPVHGARRPHPDVALLDTSGKASSR